MWQKGEGDSMCSIKMSEGWQDKSQTAEHWTYGWTVTYHKDSYNVVLLSNCGKAAWMSRASFLTAFLILMSSVAKWIQH